MCLFGTYGRGVAAQEKGPFQQKKIVERKTQELAEYLGLNAEQKAKLLELNQNRSELVKSRRAKAKANIKKQDSTKPTKAQQIAIRNEARKEEQAFQQAVKKILTPEQIKKWNKRYSEGKASEKTKTSKK